MNSSPQTPFPPSEFSSSIGQYPNPIALTDSAYVGTILLLSEDRLLHLMMHQVLSKDRYYLVSTFSSQEAVIAYQIHTPNLILVDTQPSNSVRDSSCQTLQYLSTHIASPIVALVISDGSEIIDRVFASGACDYITQPIHWVALRHRIRYLVQSNQAYRQLQSVNTDLELKLKAQANMQPETLWIRVQHLERLHQTKDDFLNTAFHELRSPLSNMRLSIHLLAESLRNSQTANDEITKNGSNFSKILEYLRVLQSECEREISLVNNLLDLQRIEANFQPCCIETIVWEEWITDIVASFSDQASQHQRILHLDLESTLTPTTIDAGSLARIIRELLHNACKYTPPRENIVIAIKQLNSILYLTVSNSGIEIPDSERAQVFDRFYRVPGNDRQKQEGTGLGLTIVKHLVEHLNGSITVESRDRWTHFRVSLPIADITSTQVR